MFSNFHQKDRISIFLFLSLYIAGERRIKGELSQNQNNSIDRVAYYKRDEYFCALGCQNISCSEKVLSKDHRPLFLFITKLSDQFYLYFIILISRVRQERSKF